jgi:c-di-GMP-binding flagellar brake protein YcgR
MSDNSELLREAIDRNTPVTLIIPSAGVGKHFCSRFVRCIDDRILLESIPGQTELLDAMIRSGARVTVVFRTGQQRVEFHTKLLERQRGIRLNADTVIEAIHLTWPEQIKAVQRRANYRVSVTADSEITFKCWRASDQDDLSKLPSATALLVIDVRNLSAGGFGGVWKRRRDDPPTLATSQRFRIDAGTPAGNVVLDGRLRFLERIGDGDMQRIGIQFAYSASLQDRQKLAMLNKLIGELQRQELRRLKLAR